ncbi:uncharacterized protein Tco025E_03284 [Trypanosoma conorhini]|uniref:Uncharacterized protein n=1 Tax=Trypanosoma conorhini TaxID=83891 RepID=A0A422PWN1_9TRYP|nr:uncharacterized protein Tco025E_03284 [Trypanosoma conorhini]RNF22122.1 hypothetical protein Tco025E_03284 [Trypanosoma conorhini]
MTWTALRVERVLDGIAALHKRKDADRVEHLQRENERLSKELSEMERVHKAAVQDLSEKGLRMERLMRQLLSERSRLTGELAKLRETKRSLEGILNSRACLTETSSKADMAVQTDALRPLALLNEQSTQTFYELEDVAVQTDALRPLALLNERATQTFHELEDVAVQTDALRPLALLNERTTQTFSGKNSNSSMNPVTVAELTCQSSFFLKAKMPSVTYTYGLATPTSIHYVNGAERLALAMYAVGQWVESVKFDIHNSDYVFVGLNVEGWWQWRRQALGQLDAATDVVRAYSDAADPLWWCGALASALLDLDVERNMSVGDFLVASCGCEVGAETACNPVSLNEMVAFLTRTTSYCLLVTKKDSVLGDHLALVLAVSVLENEALFYIVRPGDAAAKGEETAGGDSMHTLIGEWRCSRELLTQFDLFQTVRCFPQGANPEIRWMDVVEGHLTAVSVGLPEEVSLVRDTMHARLLDLATSLWWPIEPILREGNALMFFSPLLERAAAVVVVVNVDAATVRRLDLLQASAKEFGFPGSPKAVIVQVNGQEVCTSRLTLNPTLEREAALREGNVSRSAHFAEPEPAAGTGDAEECGSVVGSRRGDSGGTFGGVSSQHLITAADADAFFQMFHRTLAMHLEFMVNYMDLVFRLLLSVMWLPSPGLIEEGRAVATPPMLSATIARQHLELAAMRTRNTSVSGALCRAAAALDSTKAMMNGLEEENGALRAELARYASVSEELRQETHAKEEQLAGAARYCGAVEEQLRLAMTSFLQLRSSAEDMQKDNFIATSQANRKRGPMGPHEECSPSSSETGSLS